MHRRDVTIGRYRQVRSSLLMHFEIAPIMLGLLVKLIPREHYVWRWSLVIGKPYP